MRLYDIDLLRAGAMAVPRFLLPVWIRPGAALLLASVAIWGDAQAATVIGVAGPSYGREQAVAEAIKLAAETAIKDINSKGGVLGEPLELLVLDDACTEGGAAAAAQTFIQRRVQLVVGHPCSKSALAAAGLYGPAGVVFIATSSRHPRLTEKRAGKTIFRLAGRNDRQGTVAAEWILAQPGTGPVAVVHDKTSYSRTLAAAVAAALVAKAQPAPLDLPFTASENDYAPIVKALVDAKPRALFFAGYPAEANIIISEARKAGVTAPVLGSESMATAEFTRQPIAKDSAMSVLSRFAPRTDDNGELAPQIDGVKQAASTATDTAIRRWAAAAVRAGNSGSEQVSAELMAAPEAANGFEANGDARVPSFFPVYWSGTRWSGR